MDSSESRCRVFCGKEAILTPEQYHYWSTTWKAQHPNREVPSFEVVNETMEVFDIEFEDICPHWKEI